MQRLFQPPPDPSPAWPVGPALQTPALIFHVWFLPSFKALKCCIVASVFVVFPAQLEAGGTRNSEMERNSGSGEILSSCQTRQSRDARRAQLWAQHPRASPLPPSFYLPFFAHPKLSSHSQSLSGRCTKPDPAVGAGNGQIIQVAEFISPFPLVANCPGADGDFLKCIRYSKSLTETAMAQTNPRPPAKPSFGLSICPAAAVGVGSAPASVPEGSGRQESGGWGWPRRLHLPPASSQCRGVGIHVPALLGFGAALSHSHSAVLCQRWGELNSLEKCTVVNWEAASWRKMPVAL